MEYGRRFVVVIVAVLVFVALAGCQSEPVEPQTPGTLRVLTYNIHHGEGTDKVVDYQRLARVIKELSPDLVALQEVDVGTERAAGADQVATLGELCGMHYAFGQAMPYQNGWYGEAVLSRFPIQGMAVHPLPYQFEQEPRAALEVRFDVPGIGPFSFIGTHLCHQKDENRIQQARRLNLLFSKREGPPLILAGDFNARPDSEPMKILFDAGWIDTVAPVSVIDYVLVRSCDPWKIAEATIVEDPVTSDHNPVLVILERAGPSVAP